MEIAHKFSVIRACKIWLNNDNEYNQSLIHLSGYSCVSGNRKKKPWGVGMFISPALIMSCRVRNDLNVQNDIFETIFYTTDAP